MVHVRLMRICACWRVTAFICEMLAAGVVFPFSPISHPFFYLYLNLSRDCDSALYVSGLLRYPRSCTATSYYVLLLGVLLCFFLFCPGMLMCHGYVYGRTASHIHQLDRWDSSGVSKFCDCIPANRGFRRTRIRPLWMREGWILDLNGTGRLRGVCYASVHFLVGYFSKHSLAAAILDTPWI